MRLGQLLAQVKEAVDAGHGHMDVILWCNGATIPADRTDICDGEFIIDVYPKVTTCPDK